jgi:hypothetical protein
MKTCKFCVFFWQIVSIWQQGQIKVLLIPKKQLWKKGEVILKPPSLHNSLQQEYQNITRFFKEIMFLFDLCQIWLFPLVDDHQCDGYSQNWGKKFLVGRDY